MKYIYPAVFTSEKDGSFSVSFPDLEGCCTFGNNLQDALDMAEDALCLMLYDMEVDGREIPSPSTINALALKPDDFASLVHCDTEFYRRFYKSKAVKKTLSIPEWLNDAATKAGLNFSQTLQDGLKKQLGM